MNNVLNMQVNKKFKAEQELYVKLKNAVHEYDGVLSVVAVIGILELVKDSIMRVDE